MKKLIFYNHFHNGDIHVSRSFIRFLIEKLKSEKIEFFYFHRNSPNLLLDIPELKIGSNLENCDPAKTFVSNGNSIYLNTWYNSGQGKYMSSHGITFDTLYDLFDDFSTQILSCSLSDLNSDPKSFFPKIDFSFFSNFKIPNMENKKILFSNGSTLSGQADNFNFSPIINHLVQKYPNVSFFCTEKKSDLQTTRNLFYTTDVIRSSNSDLNEIGYLSTFCDLIVGRASGPWTFAFNFNNIFQRSAKMISFSNLTPKYENKFWLGDKFANQISYSSQILISPEYKKQNIIPFLENQIQNLN
jgi:hypothetical protein